MAALVSSTDHLSRTLYISDALMTTFLVRATDEIPGARSLFGAGEFADALSFVGTGYLALKCCIEVELFVFKKAVRRGC